VIRTFRHRGLQALFETGRSAKVRFDLQARCLRRLDALDNAATLAELNLPGFEPHPLKGKQAGRHAIRVNGPWRITFEWIDGDAYRVDLEQYH
jgi:proteic killer suppression protein